ncbi:uncharacterized protein LOC126827302 [Patella vulgata]|uniref:uncharacterized protein LOC126827302 n=1 Tax=Patella vulgata TaxID=6465 RepID=UPI00217FFD16|nr:uncharacterized protein LOC126827302 [Patella vulgata]
MTMRCNILYKVGIFLCVCSTIHAMDLNKVLQKLLLRKQQTPEDPFKINKAIITRILDHPVNMGVVYRSACMKLQTKDENIETDLQVRALLNVFGEEEADTPKRSVLTKLKTICQGVETDPQTSLLKTKEYKDIRNAFKVPVTPSLLLNFGCQGLKSVMQGAQSRDGMSLDRQVRLLLKLTDDIDEDDDIVPIDHIETTEDDDDNVELGRPKLGERLIDLCDAIATWPGHLSSNNSSQMPSGPLFKPITGKDVFRVACSRAFKPIATKPMTESDTIKTLIKRILNGDEEEASKVDPINERLKDFCRALFRRKMPLTKIQRSNNSILSTK